ncbi:MAG: polysaccharide biosynthesis C-terminal domain-containing protein, partial [Nitrospira sp.]|nr:polysaccharide biosynthesis C-terminal domain-containing protein [Nitrospira sp.]
SAFYSLKDKKTPALTAGIAVVANILLSVWLMTWLQAAGLALATALASMLNGSILVAVLHRRLGSVDWATIGRSALRVLAASVPLVAICLWVAESAVWSAPGAWVAKTAVLAGGIGASVFGYLGLHIWMGSEELDVVLGMVKRKFGRLTRRAGGN